MTRHSFHKDALHEFREARKWYADLDGPGLARAFRQSVHTAINLIKESPNRWPMYMHGTRRYRLRRFPYAIVYLLEPDDHVFVLAVLHQHRRPGYWMHRLIEPS